MNNTRQPFSSNDSPMAEARCDFPPPGGPNSSKLAPLSSQPSPAQSAETCALEIIGTASKSKFVRVFSGNSFASPRWRSMRRRSRSVISCSASASSKRAAGQPSLSERSANFSHKCLIAGRRSSFSSSVRRVVSMVAFMPLLPHMSRSAPRTDSAAPAPRTLPVGSPDPG